MGVVTIVFIFITAISLVGGILLGLKRGFKRSLIKFLLILLCVFGAFLLKGVVTDLVCDIEIEGETVWNKIMSEIPQELHDASGELIENVITIIFNVLGFIVAFLVLYLIAHFVLFPIIKLFACKKERKAKKQGEKVRYHRVSGMILGLIGGVIIAFSICVPATGMSIQAQKILDIEFEGKSLDLGIDFKSYNETFVGKFYNDIGGWAFDLIAQTENSKGETVHLSDTVDAVVGVSKMVKDFEEISKLDFKEGITADNVDDLSNALRDLEKIKGEMSDEARKIISDVASDFADVSEAEISDWISNDFDLNKVDFDATADAVDAMWNYRDSKEIDENVVSTIIKGFENNAVIVNAMANEKLIEIESGDEQIFEDAISSSSMDEETKNKVRAILGLSLS